MPTHDVIIIGAGPAGSAAATLLAGRGRSVLLVDQKTFPRDKVCGGCLSGAAVSRLNELSGDDSLPGIPGSRIAFVFGKRRILGEPRGATRLVLRAELDAWMIRIASAAGAQLRFGEPASLVAGTTGFDVQVNGERFCAAAVLVACGSGRIPAALGISGRRLGPAMIGWQWLQLPTAGFPTPGCAELHWLAGGYVGLATLDARRTIVALAARTEDGGGCPFERLRKLNSKSAIWDLLPADAPRQFGAKGAAGFPWWPRALGRGNVMLMGDAAGFAEPFTGEGIGQALFSAECAANALLDKKDILRRYTALMQPHRRVLRRTCTLSRVLNAGLVHALGEQLLPPGRLGSLSGVLDRLLSRIINKIHVGAAT